MSKEEVVRGIIPLVFVVFGWIVTTWQNNSIHKKTLKDGFCDTLKDFSLFVQEVISKPNWLNITKITLRLEQLRIDSKRINSRRCSQKVLREIETIESLFEADDFQEIVSLECPKDPTRQNKFLLMVGSKINTTISLVH